MRIYLLFFLLLIYCPTSLAFSLHYTVKQVIRDNTSEFLIKMSLKADESGVTKINFPGNWAGMKDTSKGFYEFSLDQMDVILENKQDYLCIYSPPSEILTLNYRVRDQIDHPFKPKIKDDFFWFIGKTVFLTPDASFEENIKMSIEWDRTKIFNSFGSGKKNQNFDTTLNKFLDSLFTGGNLANQTFLAQGNTFNLVTYPIDVLKNEQLVKLVESVITKQYETMTGEAKEYLISLIELNNNEPVGINLNNAFSMTFSDFKKYPLDSLLYFLIHEHFHTWIGKKIMSTDDYEHQMWFMEGFNDFCALLHAYESGLISFDKYINFYNKILKSYMINPLKNIPYDVTAKRYWEDAASLQLYPYRAGHIFAQELNYLLKLKKPSNSLINVFKQIFEEYKEDLPLVVNTKDILDLLDEYAYPDTSDLWEKYFNRGEIIPPNPNLFADIAQLKFEEVEIVDCGFNFRSAYQFNIIENLQEQSNAFLSGLQENQKIESMNLEHYPESIYMIMSDGKNINLTPNKRKIKIPQYVLKQQFNKDLIKQS